VRAREIGAAGLAETRRNPGYHRRSHADKECGLAESEPADPLVAKRWLEIAKSRRNLRLPQFFNLLSHNV
jgi:hypothetical protein